MVNIWSYIIIAMFTNAKQADAINEHMPNIQIPQVSMRIKKPGQKTH